MVIMIAFRSTRSESSDSEPKYGTGGLGMDDKTEDVLKVLIERGKQSGSLTFDEVNQALPEGTSDAGRLEDILEQLEQNGINVIDPEDGDEQPARPAEEVAVVATGGEEPTFSDNEGDGRHIDDPVRMYLTQMGEIPLLDRRLEISLAQKIEVTRRRFRRKVLECDYAHATSSRRSSACSPATCRSTARSRSRRPRTSRKTRSFSECRTTCGRSNR